MNTQHLNEEQFEELLAGNAADAAAEAHLQECADCRNELASIGFAVGELRDLSMIWAEQRGARIRVPSPWLIGWHAIPRWSVAVAAVLLIGIGIGMHGHSLDESSTTAHVSRYQPAPPPSEDELAQDNQLLQSIDDELHPQIRPQVPVSELAGPARAARRTISSEIVN